MSDNELQQGRAHSTIHQLDLMWGPRMDDLYCQLINIGQLIPASPGVIADVIPPVYPADLRRSLHVLQKDFALHKLYRSQRRERWGLRRSVLWLSQWR